MSILAVINHRLTRACLGVAALAAVSSTARAQAPHAYRTLVSINPLGLPFEIYTGEVEQKISNIVTIGGAFSHIGAFSDASYTTFEGKLRVYPNEEAFKGFSIGIGAGVSRLTGLTTCDIGDCRTDSRSGPSISVLADYNWLLGKSKRVLVGTGIGAKRVFVSDDDIFQDLNVAYPTVRFQIGMIF